MADLVLYIFHHSRKGKRKRREMGLPDVAQWIKNLIAAAQVAVEVRVQSPASTIG